MSTTNTTGKINVQTDNIFPIIKKFLYSDNEIFVRELVSNAVDATKKLKALGSMGEFKGEIGETRIEIELNKEAKTLTIKDRGLGMTAEEVDKYINQIAFSGAEEFVQKYKDKSPETNLIGHFGLGFYSGFMVASKVEIETLSFREGAKAVRWECDGSPNFTITEIEKAERGTNIILHIADDSLEFLEHSKIQQLLDKYCKFLPVEIQFGTKKEYVKAEGEEESKEVEVANIINNPAPAWTKKPADLKEEDYANFYRELYPMNFDEPLFNIHLNVDYPFNLTGILYFPKLKKTPEIQKNKIQLYSNQVFVSDNVEGIVPDFLMLLQGVLDSPDIPLNVSRSYLQSDNNVKKISNHITKKVADKLEEIFKKDRAEFERTFEDIKVFIEYGMISEEKFYDKVSKFALYKTAEGVSYTFDELVEKIKPAQTDKDDKLVILYTNNVNEQYSYIQSAKAHGYETIVLDSQLTPHLIQNLEGKNDKTQFVRVDADTIDNLIKKSVELVDKLTDAQREDVKKLTEELVNATTFKVEVKPMHTTDAPIVITQSEFMRRMKEASVMGGGMSFYGSMPDNYNLVVNANNSVIEKILKEGDPSTRKEMMQNAIDLAKLTQNLLKGEELSQFVNRTLSKI
ncbi:MAG: molecular chaperone HtpG [Bacteroidia bacterium]